MPFPTAKALLLAIATALPTVALATPSRAANDTLTINPTVQHQTIAGFGTYLNTADTPTLQAWKALGLTIMRMDMPKEVLETSPTDEATRIPLSPNLQANVALMNFATPEVAASGATAQWLKSNVPQFKLIADCWSPPHWMKGPTGATQQFVGNPASDSPAFPTPWLSNTYNHWANTPNHFVSTSGASIGGRLKTEDPTTLSEYGRYFAAWVTGFQQTYKVPLANISLQNESGFENPFDSMTLTVNAAGQSDPTQYALALKSVRDAFAANNIATPIRGPHFNIYGSPSVPWALTTTMQMIQGVKSNADATLQNALAIYSCNYYMAPDEDSVKTVAAYWFGSQSVPNTTFASWIDAPGLFGDKKQNWFVETADGPADWTTGANGTPGDGAITVALNLHNALVQSNASAYLYWQFVDGTGTPSSYGLLGDGQQPDPTASKKYDAFAQFSKFVPPGSVRIDATFASSNASATGGNSPYDTIESLDVSAYRTKTGITIVLINATPNAHALNLNLPAYLHVNTLNQYRTSATENLAQLPPIILLRPNPSVTVPPYSVVTLTGASLLANASAAIPLPVIPNK
jgi:O-glycosyl hydrolase